MSDPATVRDIRDSVRAARALRGRGLPRRARHGSRRSSRRCTRSTRSRASRRSPARLTSIAISIGGATRRSPACRSRSRTTSARAACARPPRRASSRRIVPPYDATVVVAARSRRRRHHRQDQLRRVRDGIVDRELGVRPGAQSVGARSHSRRIERRVGRGGRRRHRAARARIRHRRVDPAAGRACAASSA